MRATKDRHWGKTIAGLALRRVVVAIFCAIDTVRTFVFIAWV